MRHKKHPSISPTSACPCQSGRHFQDCCQHYLSAPDSVYPETAEQLMRSRYSAFALGLSDYIMHTWHPAHRPAQIQLHPNDQWIGLKIIATEQGQAMDESAMVHFIARYKINGKAFKMEERSLFEKQNGRWLYTKAL